MLSHAKLRRPLPQESCEILRCVAVPFDVLLGGMLGVLDRVQLVAVREMGMMACLFMVASLGVLRRLAMVRGRVLVVLSSFVVMVMNV